MIDKELLDKAGKFIADTQKVVEQYEVVLQEYKNELKNSARFLSHLSRIAYKLDIDWWDGDFPIEEIEQAIDNLKKDKS